MFLAIALMTIAFSACKDEEYPLDGTVWVKGEGTNEVRTITFAKTTFTNLFTYDNASSGELEILENKSGTYTFDDPTVTFDLDGEKGTGTISGSTLTTGSGTDAMVFKKK